MHAKPRPILGATLGLLLGIVTMGLLWQLGILPPDRLALFGLTAVTMIIVTSILTQRAGLVRARFTIMMVLAGTLAGVSLTGIPEAISAGSIDEGCSLTVTSSLGTATPASTTAIAPFTMTPDDTIEWQAATAEPLTNWDATMGFRIGGFDVPRWDNQVANADGRTEFAASGSVAEFLDDLGIQLRGTTHVYAVANAAEGSCAVDGFVDIASSGPFETPVLVTLWVALWVLLLAIVVLGAAVRRTISRADRSAAPGAPTLGTGGNAATRTDDPQGTATGSPGKVTDARRRAANGSSGRAGGSSSAGRGASKDAGREATPDRARSAVAPAAGATGLAAADMAAPASEPAAPGDPEPEPTGEAESEHAPEPNATDAAPDATEGDAPAAEVEADREAEAGAEAEAPTDEDDGRA